MHYLFFIYQWVIALPLIAIATIITALVTIIGCSLGNSNVWGYYPGKYWSRFICFILFIPIEIRGKENIKDTISYVFVANHQGAFDIFLIYGYLNRSFKWLMKKELRNFPFVGSACLAAGHIFVDNSSPTKIKETLQQAEKILQNGISVVVFPEGARTLDGQIHCFKRGAFQLAIDLNLPIVPMTIEGPYIIMKRNTYTIHPHKMTLTIHQPIYPNKEAEHPLSELKEYAFDIISKELSK